MVACVTSCKRNPGQWRDLVRQVDVGLYVTADEHARLWADFQHDLDRARTADEIVALASFLVAVELRVGQTKRGHGPPRPR